MPSLPVADTSVLQYLHHLGLIDLLPQLFGGVVVPAAVADELAVGRRQGCLVPDVSTLAWVEVVPNIAEAEAVSAARHHRGERQVIAVACERGAQTLLDDRPARRTANQMAVSGTVGILAAAKQLGILRMLRPELDRLAGLGFRLDQGFRRHVLAQVGEEDDDA